MMVFQLYTSFISKSPLRLEDLNILTTAWTVQAGFQFNNLLMKLNSDWPMDRLIREKKRTLIPCVPSTSFMQTYLNQGMFSKSQTFLYIYLELSSSCIHLTRISLQQNLEYLYFRCFTREANSSRVYHTFRKTHYIVFSCLSSP